MARTVAAAEFENHSLALLQEVAETQEEMVIMRDGKPLAKVVPVETNGTALTIDEFRRRYPVRIVGDITEPLDDAATALFEGVPSSHGTDVSASRAPCRRSGEPRSTGLDRTNTTDRSGP